MHTQTLIAVQLSYMALIQFARQHLFRGLGGEFSWCGESLTKLSVENLYCFVLDFESLTGLYKGNATGNWWSTLLTINANTILVY